MDSPTAGSIARAVARLCGAEVPVPAAEILTVANIDQVFTYLHNKHRLRGWFVVADVTTDEKQVFSTGSEGSPAVVTGVSFTIVSRFRFFDGPHAGHVVETTATDTGKEHAVRKAHAVLLLRIAEAALSQPASSDEIIRTQLQHYVSPYVSEKDPEKLLGMIRSGKHFPLPIEQDVIDCKDWFRPGETYKNGWPRELVNIVVAMLNSKPSGGAVLIGIKETDEKEYEIAHCNVDLEILRNTCNGYFADCNPPLLEGTDFGFYEIAPPPRRVVLLTARRVTGRGFLYKNDTNQVLYRYGPATRTLSGKRVRLCEGVRGEEYEKGYSNLWSKELY